MTTTKTSPLTTIGRARRRPRRRRPPWRTKPALRFTPYAWAKLLCLRDAGPTEVGGFGITAEADPLLVEDLRLVRQACTAVTVRFDDAAVADHFDECVDAGLPPERFARVWAHTHPGDCPRPSGTDERTFARVFGGCDWAVMFVLARGGDAYARLRFNAGPGGELLLPVEVDYSAGFAAADPPGWAGEYAACVTDESASLFTTPGLAAPGPAASRDFGRFASPDAARRDLSAAGDVRPDGRHLFDPLFPWEPSDEPFHFDDPFGRDDLFLDPAC